MSTLTDGIANAARLIWARCENRSHCAMSDECACARDMAIIVNGLAELMRQRDAREKAG